MTSICLHIDIALRLWKVRGEDKKLCTCLWIILAGSGLDAAESEHGKRHGWADPFPGLCLNPYPSCTVVVIKDKHVIYGSVVSADYLPSENNDLPASHRPVLSELFWCSSTRLSHGWCKVCCWSTYAGNSWKWCSPAIISWNFMCSRRKTDFRTILGRKAFRWAPSCTIKYAYPYYGYK